MRKASRAMDAAFALEVLEKAPYITVSFTRPDGTPYGVPLSLARTDERIFYFHCAMEGEKLDCIAANPMVALSAVTRCTPTVGPKDGSFTLQYNSAMAVGKIEGLAGTTPWILKDFRSPRRVLTGIQNFYNMKGLVSDRGERKKAWYVLKEWYEGKSF